MLNDFYGGYDSVQLETVTLANPHIKDFSRVNAGEEINLPAIPVKTKPLPSGRYWVLAANSENIEEAYELYKNHQASLRYLKFLPYWNSREGLVFAIFLRDGYPDMESALVAAGKLPKSFSSNAKVLAKLDDDTIFFAR